MLRELGRSRDDGTPHPRKAENDPADSVFVVLLADEIGGARTWNVGSVWLTLGEAQGAANRYQVEGHRAHHGWQFISVMEYQTGQLAPKAERHGEELPFRPQGAIGPTSDDKIAELEMEITRLRAASGQSQTVGA